MTLARSPLCPTDRFRGSRSTTLRGRRSPAWSECTCPGKRVAPAFASSDLLDVHHWLEPISDGQPDACSSRPPCIKQTVDTVVWVWQLPTGRSVLRFHFMSTPDVRTTIPVPVDPAATPALCGVFEPIEDERDAVDLVVEGDLPSDFRGAYLRNGPNPLFPPLGSYTYPIDGDGMVHGLWFDGPRVRYRNRTVWTPHLRYEVERRKAVWAGLMTPYLPGSDEAPEGLANTYKPLADINVIVHAGRLLALCEVDPPVQLTAGLDTVGPYTFGGAIGGMCAHPRIDAKTGEMVIFRYNLEEPYLMWASVGPDGRVASCAVTSSSGSSVLDDTVCRLLARRAKFNPGKDSSGAATGGVFSSRFRWQIQK